MNIWIRCAEFEQVFTSTIFAFSFNISTVGIHLNCMFCCNWCSLYLSSQIEHSNTSNSIPKRAQSSEWTFASDTWNLSKCSPQQFFLFLFLFPYQNFIWAVCCVVGSLCPLLFDSYLNSFHLQHLIFKLNPKKDSYYGMNQGILKGEVTLYHLPPVWLVWISLFCK